MRLYLFILGQLLFCAAICCLVWFVFIDWHKATGSNVTIAIGVGAAFAYQLYFLLSGLLYGKEVSRQGLSLTLPRRETVRFSTDNLVAGKFLIFCRNTNLRNLTGSITLRDGLGKVRERLQVNSTAIFGDEGETKIVRISRGGKSAKLDMLRVLTLKPIDQEAPFAQIEFNLDWHPRANDARSKAVDFEVIFRAKKLPQENLAPTSQVMLN